MRRFVPAAGVQDETLKQMAIGLYPLLQQLSQVGDEHLEFAGWKWFLLIVEQHLGSERFEEVVNSYMSMKERGGSNDIAHGQVRCGLVRSGVACWGKVWHGKARIEFVSWSG